MGNVLHHAIEMYLKGTLSKSLTLDDLKKLSHNLPKIWDEFKAGAVQDLTSFDSTISSLDAFEELRFPDSILTKGMAATVGISRNLSSPSAGPSTKPEPEYDVYLEEIDALVNKIFEVASVNPAFFMNRLRGSAREHLCEANAQPWAGQRQTGESGTSIDIGERYKSIFLAHQHASDYRLKILTIWGAAHAAFATVFVWVHEKAPTISWAVTLLWLAVAILLWFGDVRNRPAIKTSKTVGAAIESRANLPFDEQFFSRLDKDKRLSHSATIDILSVLTILFLLVATTLLLLGDQLPV